MPKRLAQMIAIAVLLITPLIVSVVSQVQPQGEAPDPANMVAPPPPAQTVVDRTPLIPPAPSPPAGMQAPPMQQQQQTSSTSQPSQASAEPMVSAAPMLDPQGIVPQPASQPVGDGMVAAGQNTPPQHGVAAH